MEDLHNQMIYKYFLKLFLNIIPYKLQHTLLKSGYVSRGIL